MFRNLIQIFIIILFSISCNNNSEKDNLNIEDITYKSISEIDSVINKTNNKSKLAMLYFRKGQLLSDNQDNTKAIKSFEKSLKQFQKDENQKYIANTYWHLGSSNAFINNTELATKYLLIALDMAKELNEKTLEANVYSSLSHIYFLYKDFNSSIDYTLKAIEIYSTQKDTVGISAAYNNLAVIYKNVGDYKNAISYNKMSLDINIIKKDSSSIAKSYNNLGLAYEFIGDAKKAETYFLKASNINDKIGSLNSSPKRNIGSLYFKQKKYEKAKKQYLLALILEKKSGSIFLQKGIYNDLLKISLNNNDFNNSVLYKKKLDSLSIIYNENETQKKLDLLENQYKLVAKTKDLVQAQKINKKNKIIFSVITILVTLLALFWLLYLKNQRLKNEKERIRLEQKVLRSQMNPHFIFNVLSSIQNSLLNNEPIKSAGYLSRFAKLIRQNFDFINERTILLSEEIDALQNYMDTQKLRFNDKFDYEINIFADVDVNLVEIPPLLLQPFIENSIEHGFKNKKDKGIITINISKEINKICYEIKDNGKGYSTLQKNKKIHSIDVFKKRLKLMGKKEEQSLIIRTSDKGTKIKFCIKL